MNNVQKQETWEDVRNRALKARERLTVFANVAKNPVPYRDALDRARAAAKADLYHGLADLIIQSRRSGDKSLELACWDCCLEQEAVPSGPTDWVETVQAIVDMAMQE